MLPRQVRGAVPAGGASLTLCVLLVLVVLLSACRSGGTPNEQDADRPNTGVADGLM